MLKKKKPLEQMTLEEKVDEILRFQKSMRRWNIVKALTNVTLFLLFIILPILGVVYFFDWVQNSVGLDLSQFRDVLENFRNISENTQAVEERTNDLLDLLNQ